MFNYYKTMCAFIVCVQMKLHQSTCNSFKGKLLKQLKQEVDSLRLGSRSRRTALDTYNKYKEQSNVSNTVSDALKIVHCPSVPVGSEHLYHINCASNRCDKCPEFKQPSLEKSSEEYISFKTFEVVNYCTEHLSLPTDAIICSICNAREDGGKKVH